MSSRPLAGTVAASVLVLAGALSGCGVAGTGFHPGVAAQVGDDQIKVSQVDEIASNYCSAITEQLRGENQVLPLRYLRGGIAGQLALVAAAEQLADEYGVEPGPAVRPEGRRPEGRGRRPARGPAGRRGRDRVVGVVPQRGPAGRRRELLREQGNAQPTIEESTQAGQQAFNEWLDEQDVSIDPQFGVELKDGQAVPTDTSLSHAVGTTAKNGNADSPDPAYAGSLPASLRCG